ncbi:MAG: DUF2269 family protein, partial [Trebonia sp.]
MQVTTYGVILFLHITAAIVGFMLAGVLHAALQSLARARTVGEARSWAAVVHRLDPLFPLVALLLIGFGAWLIHLRDQRLSWSDGWILTSVISLVVVEGIMGATVAQKSKRFVAAIHAAPDAPLGPDLKAFTVDPMVWHMSHVASFGLLGVVFLMAAKPDGVWSPVVVVVAALIGVAASIAQLRALNA